MPRDVGDDGRIGGWGNSTFEIEEFFEFLKDKWRTMECLPVPDNLVGDGVFWGSDEDVRCIEKTLVDAGWQGDGDGVGWRRDDARKIFAAASDGWCNDGVFAWLASSSQPADSSGVGNG
jgi:hypothetical protein